MNKQQISKLNMYLAVQKALKAKQGVIEGFARLNTEVLNFEQQIGGINALNTALIAGTVGTTNSNTQLETDMVLAVCKLSRLALVWAKDSKNEVLIDLFDITRTDLQRMTDADCFAKANAVLLQIEANVRGLATVGVKAADITAARALVDSYGTSLGSTQSALKGNKVKNAETKALFAQADASLAIIGDLLINGLDDAELTSAFVATRVINDAAVRRTGIHVKVADGQTNEPIVKAVAYLEGTDKRDEADEEGVCEFYKLRMGNYVIKVEAVGYLGAKVSTGVEQGKITDLEVALVKA